MTVPEFLELLEKLGFSNVHFSVHLENQPYHGLTVQSVHSQSQPHISKLAEETDMDYSVYKNEDGIFYYVNFY
jgi:hypothetical protein